MSTSAVVFGYGDVGVRCTRVLLARGVDVRLIVTHEDDPLETRWYSSLADFATEAGIPVIAPARPDERLAVRVRALAPDFIFSFYYRQLLPGALLEIPGSGALNMHGSLLPRFRGRAPVNWAVLHGATQTGATLHYMSSRADAGDIVDQAAVPIGENDTAHEVFLRVTDAAETVLKRSLPLLVAGTAPRTAQDLSKGEYCGRRRPEDGRIEWWRTAREIHNLVRAVAPPFPGAFANFDGERWMIARTRMLPGRTGAGALLKLHADAGRCVITCADGERLELLEAADPRGPVDLATLRTRLERSAIAVS
ncbi:MAG TPA: formyltransferase [Steroidobacteraceae bacterium]|nr:formyltransferase [Steroidobacteraceae bacterium]